MRKWTAMILFCCLASSARAAVVYLKDGRRMEGTIVGATARDVQLHTPQETLTIEADQIARIDYEGQPPPPPPRQQESDWEGAGNQEFSLVLGLTVPMSRLDAAPPGGRAGDNGDAGGQLGVQYLYLPSERLGTGVSLEYLNRGATDDLGFVPAADANVSGGTFLALAMVKYALAERGRARPYLIAGAGADHTSLTIDAAPLFGFTWSDTGTAETRQLMNDSRWGPAAAAGVGIDFSFSDLATAALELRWTGWANGRYAAAPAGRDLGLESETGNFSALNIGIRWGWRF